MSWLKRQNGDTLVEVTFAIAILTVVLVTAYNIASVTVHTGLQARERTEAAKIAQDQAEQLRGWRDYDLANGNTFFANDPGLSACFSGPCTIYIHSVQCTGANCGPPSEPGNALYKVQVQAAWDNPQHSRVLFSIKVRWENAVDPSTQNVTSVDFRMADTSKIKPIPCAQPENCT
jgi:Tfp pilus assembly protein PilV